MQLLLLTVRQAGVWWVECISGRSKFPPLCNFSSSLLSAGLRHCVVVRRRKKEILDLMLPSLQKMVPADHDREGPFSLVALGGIRFCTLY